MFALDLFNTDHERRLAEGAVDQLEQRRIDDLAMKMDDLVARARKATTAEAKAALVKEFQKCKDERDNYFKIKDECMGYGGLVGEAGLPDIADKAAKMARLNQPGRAGTDVVTPQQRVNPNPNKGVIGHAADWLRGKGGPGKEGPTYEEEELDEADDLSKISIARYVYAQIMKALEGNLQFDTIYWPQGSMTGPKLEATLSRNQMHYLIERLVKMTREQRKQFTNRVLSDRNATLQWLTSKPIKPAPAMPQPAVEPGQMSLDLPKPVGEARGQKKNSEKVDGPVAQDAEVQNKIRKLRAKYPGVNNDVEALAKDEMVNQARVDQTLNQQQTKIQKQDSTLAQLTQVNQQQDATITKLQQQLATAVRNLGTTNPATTQAATATPVATATTQTAPATAKAVTMPEPVYLPTPVTVKDQELYDKIQGLEKELKDKIDAMASWNAIAQKDPEANNELEALRKEVERTRQEIQSQVKKLRKQTKKTAKQVATMPQATAKDMGTVRQVPSTPQLGQTPTDAGELGQQIGQRARANKRAKYSKRARKGAETTDMDIMDLGQASDYLSGLRKRSQTATTVEPTQPELAVAEGTAEQFGQAVRQADQTGRQLERDPEFRRLQQQKMQREKFKARSQAGYKDDEEQDFQDIDEGRMSELSLEYEDWKRMAPVSFLNRYKISKDDWYAKYSSVVEPKPARRRMSPELARSPVGKKMNAMYSSTCPGCGRSTNPDRCVCEDSEPQMFVIVADGKRTKAMQSDMADRLIAAAQRTGKYKTVKKVLAKAGDLEEGWQDFKKVEPYAVCLAGKPVKKFDYYEQARQFHDNWKAKLYREGNKEKADKITLLPIMDEAVSKGTPVPAKDFIKGVLKDLKKVNVKEAEGSWIVYDPETKQIKKRFKTHTAGKSYAKTHGLGFASSEYYFDNIKQGVTETVTDVRAEMARVYHKLAPKIERYRDSFLAGQLYDELENIAELHGAEAEFKRMIAGARNRAHMEYDTNPGGFQNWFWYLPFEDEELDETKEIRTREDFMRERDRLYRLIQLETDPANKQILKTNIRNLERRAAEEGWYRIPTGLSEETSTSSEAVEIALIRRVLVAHTDLIMEFGLDKVTQAIEEVAYNVGDLDEIGSSDVSGWMNQVKQILGVE
jgi:HAMP domain-containing protein